jgi:hypothetical protein
MTDGVYDLDGRCVNCKKFHPCDCEINNVFLGSANDNETHEEHLARELKWKEEHSCNICGSFECDGSCEHEIDEMGRFF